jgi:hypothetical protein
VGVVDIAPGNGIRGVHAARRALLRKIRDAIQEALSDEAEVRLLNGNQVTVRLDRETTVAIDCWPDGTEHGLNPVWYYARSRGGSVLDLRAPTASRTEDHDDKLGLILDAARRVLATVTLVTT